MASTQIDFVFGLRDHPQKDQMTKEVRAWLVNTDPIPGSLGQGQKPGRVEIWFESNTSEGEVQELTRWFGRTSPVQGDDRLLVKYEGCPPGHWSGYFVPISFVPK